MSTDGLADFEFGDATLEAVGGIGEVCFVAFALSCKEVGEVGVVEELSCRPGILLKADACLNGFADLVHLFEQPVLDLGEDFMRFLIDDAIGHGEFELRVGKEPIGESVLWFWVREAGKAAEVPPVG